MAFELSCRNVLFSVQAIDASYAGSAFSSPVQFKVTALGIDSDSAMELRIH
jgi:hypothetical protein